MKRHLTSLVAFIFAGAMVLGNRSTAGAQDYPQQQQYPSQGQYPVQDQQYPAQQQYPQPYPGPSSQNPEEIPAPPAPQQPGVPGAPPQGQPQAQGQQEAGPGAARISFLRGDVSTQHSDNSEWTAATINTPVFPGDHVATGQKSRTEVQLDHANVLRMSDESTANIATLTRTAVQVQIGRGLVNYDILPGNEAQVEIDTPNVTIHPQLREGAYRVLVNSDGETVIDVRNGSAEISTPQGSTRVDKGQSIRVLGNDASTHYSTASASQKDEWDQWNSDRDRVIQSAASWRYTDPYYNGSQDLDAYGQWNSVPDYGNVWFPSVDAGWAPYRAGRWCYEPYYGWTWVSSEPWGWAPYHYGRWSVYGGRWGWWPGPTYAGYYPAWAPAYVSFIGFGGGGFGFGFGFGGGFGSIGWLPIGPGDRFYPWYGRGFGRVNAVNIYNIHTFRGGGFDPLREHAFSNLERVSADARLRDGVSSMRAGDFGHSAVPAQQQRFGADSFRQASVMTGSLPVAPTRGSYSPSGREVNPSSLPNNGRVAQQRFVTGRSLQTNSLQSRAQSGFNAQGSVNRGGSLGAVPQQNGGFRGVGPATGSNGGNWRTYTPPAGSSAAAPQNRSFENGAAGRQYSTPGGSQRSGYGNGSYGNSRPPLNMQQPVVTPRGNSNARSYPNPSYSPGNSGGNVYRGGSPSSSAPRSSGGGGNFGGSGGGHSSGGGGGHSASSGHSSGGHGGGHR